MTERPENPSVPASMEKTKRHRSTFTSDQVKQLESEYKKQPYIGSTKRKELSELLNLSDRAIKIWYQNRRSKERKDILSKQQDGDSQNDKYNHHVILKRMLSKNTHSSNELPTSIINQDKSSNTVQKRKNSTSSNPGKIPDMIPIENYNKSKNNVERKQSITELEISTNQPYQNITNDREETEIKETKIGPDSIPNPYTTSNYNLSSAQSNISCAYNDSFQDTSNFYSFNSTAYNRYSPYDKEKDSYKASAEFSIELFKKYIRRDEQNKTVTKQVETSQNVNLTDNLKSMTSNSQSVTSST